MRVGILGGTFDPVHFGHIQLALALSKNHNLDEVWWVPAKRNPLKTEIPEMEFHRLAMLKRALAEIPNFKILTIELEQPTASFTVDTLKKLKEKYPNHQFFLLLGDDVIPNFMQWKSPLEVVQLAPPLIGARRTDQCPSLTHLPNEMIPLFKKGWTEIPLLDISSTEVRNRLKNKLYSTHLIPAKVLDYITLYHLYSSGKMKQKITRKDQSLLDQIAQTIYDKKGANIIALDVREISSLTEYFVIAEGNVERHVGSIARAILHELKSSLKCYFHEGLQNGDWVVLDFGHIIVHIFSPDLREKYALEQIWKKGEIVNLNIILEGTRE